MKNVKEELTHIQGLLHVLFVNLELFLNMIILIAIDVVEILILQVELLVVFHEKEIVLLIEIIQDVYLDP